MYVALPSLSHSKSRTCRLSFSRSHTYTLDSTHRKLASIHLWPVGIITLLPHSWDNTKLGFTFEHMLAFIEYWSRVLVANYYILNNRVWFFELWKNPSKGDTTRSTAVCPEASVIQGGSLVYFCYRYGNESVGCWPQWGRSHPCCTLTRRVSMISDSANMKYYWPWQTSQLYRMSRCL